MGCDCMVWCTSVCYVSVCIVSLLYSMLVDVSFVCFVMIWYFVSCYDVLVCSM